MVSRPPTEAKVWAGTVGSGVGATVGSFVVWILGVLLWHASSDADQATSAIGSVPAPVAAMVFLAITVGSTYVGGYLAKHTPRPQPEVDDVVPDPRGGLPPVAHAEHLLSPDDQVKWADAEGHDVSNGGFLRD
jgi:hypothetical protein